MTIYFTLKQIENHMLFQDVMTREFLGITYFLMFLRFFFCGRSNSFVRSSKYVIGLEIDKNFSYFNFLIFLLFIVCLSIVIFNILFFFLHLKTGKNIESENIQRRPPFSNCSVDSELLGKLFSVFSQKAFKQLISSLFPLVSFFCCC